MTLRPSELFSENDLGPFRHGIQVVAPRKAFAGRQIYIKETKSSNLYSVIRAQTHQASQITQ
jgi:hypothetical protein